MTTKIIEWKNKAKTEYEIMKWTYNYTNHSVVRYFKNADGIITKTLTVNI